MEKKNPVVEISFEELKNDLIESIDDLIVKLEDCKNSIKAGNPLDRTQMELMNRVSI